MLKERCSPSEESSTGRGAIGKHIPSLDEALTDAVHSRCCCFLSQVAQVSQHRLVPPASIKAEAQNNSKRRTALRRFQLSKGKQLEPRWAAGDT